jgi:hypothetical protein
LLDAAVNGQALEQAPEQPAQEPAPEPEAAPAPGHGIKPEFVVSIHGQEFIRFVGLLAMAHEKGLVSLKAEFTSVTDALALAHAVATFQDGRVFEESGDATPQNVNAKVRPHFARVALTRSKARCLRDALNISLVALEELDEDSR